MLRELLSGLDPRTLIIVLALVHLGNLAFSLLLFSGKLAAPGASSWIRGQALAVMGSALLPWLGGGQALFLSIPNTFFYLSALFILDAVWRFRFGGAMPRWLWLTALAFLLGFLGLALTGSPGQLRVVYYSVWMSGASLASGMVILRGIDRRLRLPALIAAGTFFAPCPFHLLRAIQALAAPAWSGSSLFDPSQAVFYLVSIFTAYLLLLAFVLLASMRSTLVLQDLSDTQLVMLQVIAHDLRNPIGGAAHYVRRHLAPEGVDLQAKREAILVLGKTLSETDELLENLLMWAHDRTGLSKARKPEDLDLDALLRKQLGLLEEAAREKGLDLDMEEGSLHILAEPNGSAVVLRNILSNALKFTPSGGKVGVKTRLTPRGVEVAICDTGLGMDEARLAAFRAGKELPSSPGTAGERGSGLGLSLCKRFMEDQGGLLEVESRPGAGSTFTLVFPVPGKLAILKA